MLDNRTVGKTIAALRQANGMTQQKLAATMNVSHQAVSKWENGAALPDMQTMLDLSRLFGVTIEQLLLGEVPEERLQKREEEEKKPQLSDFQLPDFNLRGAVKDAGAIPELSIVITRVIPRSLKYSAKASPTFCIRDTST